MATSVIVIGVVIVVAAVVAVVWFLTGRRPPRLDPRRERLIESLIQLQRDNPRRAAEVISRSLVRAGLVWEKDLQTGSAAPQQSTRQPYADQRRDQVQRPPAPRNDHRGDSRATQQSGQRHEPRDQRQQDQRPPASPSAPPARTENAESSPVQTTHTARRRRRRRPSGPREQRPGQQQGAQPQGEAGAPQEQA